MTHIYLASQSARRKSLLEQINIDFESIFVDIDETPRPSEDAVDYVNRMAAEKAQAGWLQSERVLDIPLLAADTSVILNAQILGKPSDRNHAIEMLNLLSNTTHQVITSVAIKNSCKMCQSLSITEVTFAKLTTAKINNYVNSAECMGKAGSYAIQGFAASFVKKISGSYSGVVGLPLYETTLLLNSFLSSNENMKQK